MALTALTFSCFLLYLTSRYFPEPGVAWAMRSKAVVTVFAVALSALSLWLFTLGYDGLTAFIVWLTALMTILSTLVVSVKLNLKWLYGWGVLCVSFLLIDLI